MKEGLSNQLINCEGERERLNVLMILKSILLLYLMMKYCLLMEMILLLLLMQKKKKKKKKKTVVMLKMKMMMWMLFANGLEMTCGRTLVPGQGGTLPMRTSWP